MEVEDHPLDYGDFEGTIPQGSTAAARCRCGIAATGAPKAASLPEAQLAAGDLKFELHGERLHGSWVLVRMKGDRYGGKRTNWLLIKHRDEFASEKGAEAIAG